MKPQFPEELIERLTATRVVAGFSTANVEDAVSTAKALRDGGVDALEVTLRAEGAVEGVRAIAKQCPDILLGVGTILTVEQVHDVKEAGAGFGVAPGLSRTVIEACRDVGLPFAPGILTPSDLTSALEAGFNFVKVFPAEAAGGVDYLKSLAAPFKSHGLRYFPFGGISQKNMSGYLNQPSVVAVGGTWIAPAPLIDDRNWSAITRIAEATRGAADRLALQESA